MIRLMDHKNPIIRLGVYGKLKRIMQTYMNQNLEPVDRRLFRGLYRRRLRDFDEDNQRPFYSLSLMKRLKYNMRLEDEWLEAEEEKIENNDS